MVKKKLGVLGGMGPLATSVFFERLIKNTVAHKDQDHIDMMILNHASLPDRTEAILENNAEIFLEKITEDIKILEYAQVSNIVIPCNTSHFFYKDMQNRTDINIINMVRSTVEYINKRDGSVSKVGILATDGTILSRVYEDECNDAGIQAHIPSQAIQSKVMNIIYRIKANLHVNENELNSIIRELVTKEKCTSIILGCTELSCLRVDNDLAKYCIDPMDILVEKAIKMSGHHSIHSLKISD